MTDYIVCPKRKILNHDFHFIDYKGYDSEQIMNIDFNTFECIEIYKIKCININNKSNFSIYNTDEQPLLFENNIYISKKFVNTFHKKYTEIKKIFNSYIVCFCNSMMYLFVINSNYINIMVFNNLLLNTKIDEQLQNLNNRIKQIEEKFFIKCEFCGIYKNDVSIRKCNGYVNSCDECDKSFNKLRECGHVITEN